MAITLEEIREWTREASAEHLRRYPGRTIDPYRVMHADEWLESNDGEEILGGPDGVVAVVMVPCDPDREDGFDRRMREDSGDRYGVAKAARTTRPIVIECDDPEPSEYRNMILASAKLECR